MALIEIPEPFDSNIKRYEKISNSVQQILKKLGLTNNELKVYTYLNKNGSTKAKIIAKNQKNSKNPNLSFIE